jgi:hypothetical protein
MTTIINGSSPSITFSDSTTQTTAFTSTPSVTSITTSADSSISGLTVGKGGGAVSTNTAAGSSALGANTSGSINSAFGAGSSQNGTTGAANSSFGALALYTNTTGSYNTASGAYSLFSNTTANNNTAVGYQAGYSTTSGTGLNTFLGQASGYSNTTGYSNSFVGVQAGYSVTTGYANTFIGANNNSTGSAGFYVTTGSKNTILGCYNGNQGGLDIRTASNYIVLSDGDGNPRGIFDGSGNFFVGQTSTGVQDSSSFSLQGVGTSSSLVINHKTGVASGDKYCYFDYAGNVIGSITQNGTTAVLYNTTSDHRLKTDVTTIADGLSVVQALNPVSFTWVDGRKDDGFIAHELQAVIPNCVTGEKDAVDKDGKPIYQQMDNSGVIPFLVKAIQELKAEVDTLKQQLGAK